jgi:hypothetical protein
MQLTVRLCDGVHDGGNIFNQGSTAMNPDSSLKWSAIAFTISWTGWMVWWSGVYDTPNIIIPAICGSLAGYLWYRVMRWQFRRRGMLPSVEHTTEG